MTPRCPHNLSYATGIVRRCRKCGPGVTWQKWRCLDCGAAWLRKVLLSDGTAKCQNAPARAVDRSTANAQVLEHRGLLHADVNP